MTWTYSNNPKNSDLDAVRFLIGDTEQDEPLLEDEELEYLIDDSSSVTRAAARAAESIAAKFSRLADQSLGDYSISHSQKAEQYLELANKLYATAESNKALKARPFAGGIRKNGRLTKPDFTKDMMRYPGTEKAGEDEDVV